MGALNAVDSITLEWTLVAVSLAFVAVRLFVRGWLQSSLAFSDALVVLGWLFFVASSLNDTLSWRWGLLSSDLDIWVGRKVPDFSSAFPDKNAQLKVMQLIYASPIPAYLSLYCVKGSFLLFYLQLFRKKERKIRLALYFTIAFVLVGLVFSLAMNLFWCRPIQRNWSLNPSEVCLSSFSLAPYVTTTTFHIASDIMIYTLPLYLVGHLRTDLRLSLRKVIGLGFVLSLGWVTITCACVKTINLMHSKSSARLISMCLWDAIQEALALIVVCCPPLKWLWHTRKGSRGSATSLVEPGAGNSANESTEGPFPKRHSKRASRAYYRDVFELVVVPRPPDRSMVRFSSAGMARLHVRDFEMDDRPDLGVLPVFPDVERETTRRNRQSSGV